MSIRPLFVYGTLMEGIYRRALLGRVSVLGSARLQGYELRAADGYVFARARDQSGDGEPKYPVDAAVEGLLLQLSEAQLAIADLWEDVPMYQRVAVDVWQAQPALDPQRLPAWVYVRGGLRGEAVASGRWTAASRLEVLSEIAQLHACQCSRGSGTA